MSSNDKQSLIFQIEAIRHRTPKVLTEEYTIFLSALYGRHLEAGNTRISTYRDMTMFDITDEIKLRIHMLRADNTRKIEQHKEKQRKEQDNAIQELMQFQ